jgi:RHS repeat-associated protein
VYIPIAGRQWGEIYTSDGNTRFMHTDWLGNTRAYTKLDGSLQATCQTLPFGDARNCTLNSEDDYYAGPLWWSGDDSSYLSQTRHYNPAQAHWTTTDPAGLAETDASDPQTLNRYAYVMNNPLGFVDPTGLACYQFELQNFHRCPVPVPAAGSDQFAVMEALFEAAFLPTAIIERTDPIAFWLVYGRMGLLDLSINPLNNPPPGPGSDPAANNGNQSILTPQQQKALHCLGQTAKAKGLSIGLDVAGSIPGFGNLFSGAAAGIQGLNAAYYGTVSLANAGNTLLNPSASGAANTAATAGFAVASLTLSGSKAIPVVGTIVSLGFLAYDIAGPGGAISTYQQCMAGPG